MPINPTLSYEQILELVDALDVVAYSKTRNHLHGAVSRLSLYISRGVINLPTIRDRVLLRYSYEQAEKFIQELAWREYFEKVWRAQGDAIFSDLRFPRSDWNHHDLVSVIVEGSTGIIAIDTELTQLFTTGYMHNHARMWTAMLASNVAKAHWYDMGRFMYYHLQDGDLASNMLSWQWVAGTSVNKRYYANQDLINHCSDFTQTESYLTVPLEQVATIETPAVLHAHEPFSYTQSYPTEDTVADVSQQTVFLYHPWSLDPLWRSTETGVRLLVIEPQLFDHFPVSTKVMDTIVTMARVHIPNIQLYIGNVHTIPGLDTAKAVFSKAYPATSHWPGTRDQTLELFPNARGYFPSFFKFWEACKKA